MKIDHIACHHHMEAGKRLSRWSMIKHHIFMLVTKGGFVYKIGDETFPVKKGDGLFVPQYSMRTGSTDLSEGSHLLFIAYFSEVLPADLAPFAGPYKRVHFAADFDYLQKRFSLLNECWMGKMPGYDLICRGMLQEILGFAHREMQNSDNTFTNRNLALRVQEYIVQHYREPLRLNDLANHVDRSPAYVSTVFKEVIGRTPTEYMHEVRIGAARELLLATNMTIERISESLGYCNQTYFTQMYKRIVGHSPSQTLRMESENKTRIK